MKLPKDVIEKLYEKGHISEKSYVALCGPKKMAEGGPVSANDMYNMGDQIGQGMQAQLPDLPESVKTFTGDVGKGIGENLRALLPKASAEMPIEPNTERAPSANAKPVEFNPSVPVNPGELAADQTQKGFQVPEIYAKMLGGYQKAFDMQGDALTKMGKIGAAQAAQEAGYLKHMQDENLRYDQERQVKEQAKQDALAAKAQELEKMSQEYNNAKIDPNRVFHNASTGQKLTMFLGLALANRAAPELLNQIISRDIDAQKNDIANIGRKIGVQQSLYEQMRERFGDQRQAEAATRMVMLDNAKLRLEQLAAQYKAPQVQAQAQNMLGQLELQKQQLGMQVMQGVLNSPAMVTQDAALQKIMRIPDEKVKGQALEELKTQDTLKKSLKDISTTFNRLRELQTNSAWLKDPLQSKSLRDAYNLQLSSFAKEMYGRVNETELKLLLDKGSVGYTDLPKTIAEKQKLFETFVKTHAGTPLLDRMGLGLKQLDLTPNE